MAKARRSAGSLASTPRGEQVRWDWFGPLIAPRDRQADQGDERDPQAAILWPTYSDWAAYYASVRSEWLAYDSRAAEPVAERLFRAWQQGGDDEARRVAGEIADEGRAEIQRIYREVFGTAEKE